MAEAELRAYGGELPLPLATKPFSYSAAKAEDFRSPPPPSACPSSIDLLIADLQNSHASDQQEDAARQLRQLTRLSTENRLAFCRLDLIHALLPLLRASSPVLQVQGVAALVNFSLENPNKVKLVRAGAIPYLVELLESGDPEAQEHAAGAIFSLALSADNKHAIGALGAIPPLIHLLRSGPSRARQDAAMALYHLSDIQGNRSKLVKVGAIPILLNLAQAEDRPDLASRSLLILWNISANPDGRAALLELNAVTTLVKLLAPRRAKNKSSSGCADEISEHAAATLLLLSKGNLRFKSIAVHAGAREFLMVLANEGTPRAREKALALLAIIRESPSDPDDLDEEDSVLPRPYFRRSSARTDRLNLNSSAF